MPQDTLSTTDPASEYWISGYGLSKHVVLSQLQSFLGPTATVRPYTFKGRDGYKIVGMKLTDPQLTDLKRQSKEYERQQTIRMSGRPANGEGQPEDIDINSIMLFNPSRKVTSYAPAYTSSYRWSR